MEFLPRGFVTVNQIRFAVLWAALFTAFIIIKMRFLLVFVLASGIIFFCAFGLLSLYRRSFRFTIKNSELTIVSGVFYRKKRTIPLLSVYAVSRSQTPLEYLFKLVTVHVNGAGMKVKLPCLSANQALRFCLKMEGFF